MVTVVISQLGPEKSDACLGIEQLTRVTLAIDWLSFQAEPGGDTPCIRRETSKDNDKGVMGTEMFTRSPDLFCKERKSLRKHGHDPDRTKWKTTK